MIDSVTRELTLPDFTRVQVALATPRVFRGRTVRDLDEHQGESGGGRRLPIASSRAPIAC